MFKVGDRVRHETMGAGTITELNSYGPMHTMKLDTGKEWLCFTSSLTPLED
jgi:hypothetical protein